jgi:alkylation response protein AidB-like acyl-CoA dehydrogenase
VDEQATVDDRLNELLETWRDAPRRDFLGAQFDLGLAFVSFPPGAGGLGLSPRLQRDIQQRIAAAGLPLPRFDIGYGMGAPTIAACGTDEQRARWLRPLFTGDEVWCQLFSEPGAGSDVAGLATRAERDGDEWIVNGQKVWTSLAHFARWGLLVARTDSEVAKHRGLTYFVVDMKQRGVEVRPLRQMNGQADFNEVYFTDARVPDANRIGAIGDGWHVALVTLMNERVSIGGGVPERGAGVIRWALQAWSATARAGPVDAARHDQLVRLWIESEVLRLTNLRAAAARRAGVPGPEGSVGKLQSAELNKRVTEFAVDLLGAAGMLYPSDYGLDSQRPTMQYDTAQEWFVRSRANSIEGGTSEVMRNILAERVLGMPGDVRVDKDLPWSAVARS